MKLLDKVGIGVLSLVLGVPAVMFAQDEPKHDEPRPEPTTQDEAKPPAKPPKDEQPKPESKQDEVKPPKESKPSNQEEAKPVPGQPAHGAASAKPGAQSGHIPDKKFHANFGRAHTVVINQPVIVEGQPRFQFGGYWFIIADPWPAGWLYSDQCYIDYVDGEYVLFDLLHPGVSIVLTVVM
jgi:hypothetical protein